MRDRLVGIGDSSLAITSSNWGVLVTYRHKLVCDALMQRGVEYFMPVEEVLSIVRGRHVREMKPLLGEYIPISISAAWNSLLRVRGVNAVLQNESGMPARVLPHELERLRAMCDGNVLRQTETAYEGLKYGQKVTPTQGALMHKVGRYDGRTKRGDSALFLLFGREQRIIFRSGELQAV
jgi:hypothetical protein